MANQHQHTKEGKVFLFRCGNFVFLFFFAFNRRFGGHLESQFGRYSRCVVYSWGPFPCLSVKRKTKMRKRYLNFLCVIFFVLFFHEFNTKDGSVKSRETQMVNHRARPTCTIPVFNQIYTKCPAGISFWHHESRHVHFFFTCLNIHLYGWGVYIFFSLQISLYSARLFDFDGAKNS
jgi:hypothetical protein